MCRLIAWGRQNAVFLKGVARWCMNWLTSCFSTGRKSVVVAMLDITSVTEATMIETKRAMTILGRGLKTSRSFPSHALSSDCCRKSSWILPFMFVVIWLKSYVQLRFSCSSSLMFTLVIDYSDLGCLRYGKSWSKKDNHIPGQFMLYWVPIQESGGRPCFDAA